jgi:hypothetical protein
VIRLLYLFFPGVVSGAECKQQLLLMILASMQYHGRKDGNRNQNMSVMSAKMFQKVKRMACRGICERILKQPKFFSQHTL